MATAAVWFRRWRAWVHTTPAALAVFKVLKAIVHWLTGTSELERLCLRERGVRRTGSSRRHGRHVQAVEAALAYSATAGAVQRELVTGRAQELVEAHALDAWRAVIERKRLVQSAWVDEELQLAILRIARYHAWVRGIQKLADTAYSAQDAQHEQLLLDLWTAWCPGRPLPARVGDHWPFLGFQGHDPATDFRGMGVLGLHCLVHLARAYPADARALLVQSQHPVRWFPLAITVIAVANHVRKQLGDLWLRHAFYAEPQLDLEVYLDAVSVACIHFGKCWAGASEDITAFPTVFKRHEDGYVRLLVAAQQLPRRSDV